MTHEEEIWKRFNDILEVSNHGRIRTIERVIQGVGFARSKTKRTIKSKLREIQADYFKVHRTCISAIACKYHWAHL